MNQKNLTLKPNHGFTLIELLVVISIIGVLAALVVNNLNDSRVRARDVKRKQSLSQLKTALRLYYNDYQTYPANSVDHDLLGCGADGDQACVQGSAFSAGADPTIFMKNLPEFDSYTQTNGGDGFTLRVTLENGSDPDIASTQTSCLGTTDSTYDYIVCAD